MLLRKNLISFEKNKYLSKGYKFWLLFRSISSYLKLGGQLIINAAAPSIGPKTGWPTLPTHQLRPCKYSNLLSSYSLQTNLQYLSMRCSIRHANVGGSRSLHFNILEIEKQTHNQKFNKFQKEKKNKHYGHFCINHILFILASTQCIEFPTGCGITE